MRAVRRKKERENKVSLETAGCTLLVWAINN